MSHTPLSLADAAARRWDVIVIGTGIGGGTIGRRLAEGGLSVLFVERGPMGVRAEEHPLDPEIAGHEARLVRGFWPEPLEANVNGITTRFHAPLGAGVGGSSVFYAAALERPAPHDLDHSTETPHPTGGWPVSYAQMTPYFEEAERIYHICGTQNPLGPPSDPPSQIPDGAPLSPTDTALFEAMQHAGLHPYKGHMALKDSSGGAAYLGRKCPTDQKMDGRSAGVEPALATGRAALIDKCEALEILHENGVATGVRVRKSGTETQLTARATVLAAGALHAPRLLMASGDLGAQSGMVGRNLMFHLNEMFLLWPKRAARGAGASKALAFRDLYHHKGQRFGMVQAMGVEARYGEVLHYLNRITARSWLRHLPGRRPMLRLLAALAQRLFGSAKMFVGILEDLPKAENRVIYDPQAPQRLAIEYTMAPELLMRRRAFRKAIRRGLRGLQMMFVGVTPELNYGHPCGTLRFGDDPQNAVLDRNCAVYGTRQLWVADASFMPTSMGVNPSLTIAANALRVGDVILATLAPKERTDG